MDDRKKNLLIVICGLFLTIYFVNQIYQKYLVLQNLPQCDIKTVQSEIVHLNQKIISVKKNIDSQNIRKSSNINNELQTLLTKNNCRLSSISSGEENESSLRLTGSLNSILNFINNISSNKSISIIKIEFSDNLKTKIVTMVYKVK